MQERQVARIRAMGSHRRVLGAHHRHRSVVSNLKDMTLVESNESIESSDSIEPSEGVECSTQALIGLRVG